MLDAFIYILCFAIGAVSFYTVKGNILKNTIQVQSKIIDDLTIDNKRMRDAVVTAEYTNNIKIID